MFKTFALTFLFMALTLQACEQGCLKCTAQNNCVLCDITQFYYLNNGSCVKIAQNNCAFLRLNGNCAVCNAGYYIDGSTNKCVAVPTTKVITNCNYYDSTQSCVTCNSGYYINSANCTAVNTTVANCNTYSTNGKCSMCATGYIFNVDASACVTPPTISGCGSYTYLSCATCGTGYVNNANNYFTAFNGTSSASIFENLLLSNAVGNSDWQALSVCQLGVVTNCLTYSSFNRCALCSTGYFLTTTGLCKAFPAPIIDGCATYEDASTCASCIATKHLGDASATTCVDNTAITNCASYQATAVGATTCTACITAYYLQNNNCGTLRSNSANIANCATTSVNSDKCATCSNNYYITNDGLKCLPAIAFCATYDATISSSATAQKCTTCNRNYYPNTDSTACVAGTVSNCGIYSTANQCTTCNNGFYLNGGNCLAHLPITNCATYDGSNQNTCSACNTSFYPLAINLVCDTAPAIANCATLHFDANNSLTCSACKAGYYLSTSTRCMSIPATYSNCFTYTDAALCTVCNAGYVLTETKNCVIPFAFLSSNCNALNTGVFTTMPVSSLNLYDITTPASAATCSNCNQGYAPYDYDGHFACVEYSNLVKIGIATPTSNCMRFIAGGTTAAPTATCAECYPGYVIVQGGTPVCQTYNVNTGAPCNSAFSYVLIDDTTGISNQCLVGVTDTNYKIDFCAVAVRVTNAVAAAPVGTYTTATQAEYRCIQPDTDSVLYTDSLSSAAETDDIPYRMNSSTTLDLYPVPVLLLKNYKPQTINTATKVTNCELYILISSVYTCVKCIHGYTLRIQLVSSTATYTCVTIPNCNTSIYRGGLSSQVNKLASCHVCNAGFLVKVSWTLTSSAWANVIPTATATAFVTNECVSTTSADITAVTSVTGFAGCAMIFNDITASSTIKYCIACKPGFLGGPKASGNTGEIDTCAAISGCSPTDTGAFNSCTSCTSTASNFFAPATYQYAACAATGTNNCQVVGSTANGCALCKPGYYLNRDTMCERLVIPNCTDEVQSQAKPLASSATAEAFSYYRTLKAAGSWPLGCRKCSGSNATGASSFVGLYFSTTQTGCVQSAYSSSTSFITGTAYVLNCLNYVNTVPASGSYTCAMCNSGYIPKSDFSACVAAITNCMQSEATATNRCAVCATGFEKTDGQCLANNIPYCATVSGASNSLLCTACTTGYYLNTSTNTCIQGNVLNCKTYADQSATSCTVCLNNFTLVSSANSGTYCVPNDNTYNCSLFENGAASAVGFENKQYTCSACTFSDTVAYNLKNYPNDATKPRTICAALTSIANCITYDADPSSSINFSNNSFGCLQCAAGFYLSNAFTCTARVNLSSACTVYEVKSDKCNTCNAATFLSADATTCITFPNGILGCATYSNDTACISCNTPRYLTNNTCILSTVINNCAFYTSNYTCANCTSGFFLANSSSCVAATAQNCLTYQSMSACATCGANLGLQTTNGVTNCVSNAVSNCAVATTTFPFTCIQCSSGFYVNAAGACVGVSAAIANCLSYDSATTCVRCASPYVLAVNKTMCTNAYTLKNDANCAAATVLSTATCAQCALGSYFMNGTCTTCQNNTSTSGCLTCDPTNQSTCFACASGYYQQANGTCIRVSGQTTNNNNGTTNGTNNGTNTGSSVRITSAFGLLALVFALLF